MKTLGKVATLLPTHWITQDKTLYISESQAPSESPLCVECGKYGSLLPEPWAAALQRLEESHPMSWLALPLHTGAHTCVTSMQMGRKPRIVLCRKKRKKNRKDRKIA